jgi:hypothetical protein
VGTYDSVQFNTQGQPISDDAMEMQRQITRTGATPDGQRHGIRVQDNSLHRFQQGGPNSGTTTGPNNVSVQLHEKPNTVASIGGFRTDAKTAERVADSVAIAAKAKQEADRHVTELSQLDDAVDAQLASTNAVGKAVTEEFARMGPHVSAALVAALAANDQRRAVVAIHRMADMAGQPFEHMAQKVQVAQAEYEKRIGGLCAMHGVDPVAFAAWSAARPDTNASAMVKLITTGSVARSFGVLVRQFRS